jgi:predicted nucleotidyltransferase
MSAQFDKLLPLLVEGGIEFILIGGVAGNVHGSGRFTYDVDVVYNRSRTNMTALVECFKSYSPYLRGAPPGLPFQFDLQTLRNGLNFTLTTSLGDIDLLGEVAGGGTYQDLLSRTIVVDGFGVEFRCIDLPTLIKLKRAAGRPKDLESLAELQSLLDEEKE